jgi:hypothetical protein
VVILARLPLDTFCVSVVVPTATSADRRMKKAAAILIAFFLSSCPVAGAVVVGENPTVLIGHGHFGQRHWFVAATQDENRKGICFEAGAFLRTPRNGVEGGGQCSAPAVKRGILRTVSVPGARADTIAMTVVGGAFNVAVKSVEVTLFDGTTERLVPRKISASRAAGSTVANFRYLAFALRGPWCVERLVTLGSAGQALFETDWESIGGYAKPHDPRSACRGFPDRSS